MQCRRDAVRVGRRRDGVAAPDTKSRGLAIAHAKLDIVQGAGVAGVEPEIEGHDLVGRNAGHGEPAAEEADGVGEQRALDEARGDECKRDGDVACTCRNQALGDGLVDERLVLD